MYPTTIRAKHMHETAAQFVCTGDVRALKAGNWLDSLPPDISG